MRTSGIIICLLTIILFLASGFMPAIASSVTVEALSFSGENMFIALQQNSGGGEKASPKSADENKNPLPDTVEDDVLTIPEPVVEPSSEKNEKKEPEKEKRDEKKDRVEDNDKTSGEKPEGVISDDSEKSQPEEPPKEPKPAAPVRSVKPIQLPANISPLKTNPIHIREGESFNYKITWNNQLAGYSKFFVSKTLTLAGEKFHTIESLSGLKIGLGQIDNLTFAGQITIKDKEFDPTFFHCTQKQSGMEFNINCLFSSNLIAQQNMSPRGDDNVVQPLDEGIIPFIYMGNLWGRYDTLLEHYWIILRSGKTGRILAYDPILQHLGYIEILQESTKQETVMVNGVKAGAYKFRLLDFDGGTLFHIWTDQNRNILKMQEPGGGLTFEIVSASPVEELKQSKGVDMWQERVASSNIFFPNPREISWMTAEAEITGRGIETLQVDVPGALQTFEGDFEEGRLSGRFTIKKRDFEVKNSMEFPVKNNLSEELLPYTKEEMGIESKDDFVLNKALESSWRSKTVWEAAEKINLWVHENIPVGVSLPSAKMTLINEQGNSESRALLAIALCRALKIPARRAGGIIFSAGSFIPHHWFEVYAGEESGWIPLDPSTGEAGSVGATHIKLFETGDIWSLQIKVLDFEPKPPERLTFINREITWPVGEERTYRVVRNGKEIGKETAIIQDVTMLDEKETYYMELESLLSLDGREIKAEAKYWMSPQGLPEKYVKELSSGDRIEKQNLIMKKNMMLETLTGYRGEAEREIPFSRGAYLADSYFLCQWALIAGQLHDISIGKNYQFYVFIPETLTIESITATVRQFEAVESGDRIFDCFRVETNKGIVFWIDNENSTVVKVSFTQQGVDLELEQTRFRIVHSK